MTLQDISSSIHNIFGCNQLYRYEVLVSCCKSCSTLRHILLRVSQVARLPSGELRTGRQNDYTSGAFNFTERLFIEHGRSEDALSLSAQESCCVLISRRCDLPITCGRGEVPSYSRTYCRSNKSEHCAKNCRSCSKPGAPEFNVISRARAISIGTVRRGRSGRRIS